MDGPSQSAENHEYHLQRGQACSYCRRRKMRCDGRRPICGQCSRGSRPDDCEYTGTTGRSRADILEEDISRIQNRIYELEHPEAASDQSVFLHHPYQQPQRLAQLPSLSSRILNSSPNLGRLPVQSPIDTWWDPPEPPVDMIKVLLDTFLPYASDWGFFLDTADFRRDALLPTAMGHPSRPSPPLLTAVYLIGITLSDSATMKTHQKTFLSRTLSALPVSLSGNHPQKATHALQTEILLSNYFYAAGRLLEGRYHTTAAASLAVSSAKMRPESQASFQSPEESVEEGEIDRRWTTIILDKSWAVALGNQPNLPDSSESFNKAWQEYGTPGSNTSHLLENTVASAKMLKLLAQATILWERANNLMVSWNANMSRQESAKFSGDFDVLDTRINDFRTRIACIGPSLHASADHQLLVGNSIAHAAVIQLHSTFAQTNPESKQKCIAAAKCILCLIARANLRNLAFINPIISSIWVTACEVVVAEIAASKGARPAWALDAPTADETALVGFFDRAVQGMHRFKPWPLLKYHLAKIEQAYSAV
ncbi:hypothetical protein DFH07DRAFT_850519 [Mycena maculata]|uniref:Zn(2)-C6 fungal-type domain-containing protein n=1 Tax=Mycena maculata TaxID=230809 RepID=A0AAD7HVG5_9AGAR|nr:hypothetical protein DFH07DRAFT_850519 [Mycena maculata]